MELLSDNFSMLQTILRLLARGLLYNRRHLGLHAGYDHRPDAGLTCPAQPLDLVQRLRFLRQSFSFASPHLAALVDLARQAEEVRMEPGAVLWRQGESADWSDTIYCGTVRGTVDGGEQRFYFHDGSSVGAIDNLAVAPRWYTATAETTVVSLRITAEHLLDLFEDRFEIANDFLEMIAGELVDLLQQRGISSRMTEGETPYAGTALLFGASKAEAT